LVAEVRGRSQEYAVHASVAGGVFSPQTPEVIFSEHFSTSWRPMDVTAVAAPGAGGVRERGSREPAGPVASWSPDRVRQWAVLVAGVPEGEAAAIDLSGRQVLEFSPEELREELSGEVSEEGLELVLAAKAAGAWSITTEVGRCGRQYPCDGFVQVLNAGRQ
jgi:hypothetical protein